MKTFQQHLCGILDDERFFMDNDWFGKPLTSYGMGVIK
jgi:hypothetical protein